MARACGIRARPDGRADCVRPGTIPQRDPVTAEDVSSFERYRGALPTLRRRWRRWRYRRATRPLACAAGADFMTYSVGGERRRVDRARRTWKRSATAGSRKRPSGGPVQVVSFSPRRDRMGLSTSNGARRRRQEPLSQGRPTRRRASRAPGGRRTGLRLRGSSPRSSGPRGIAKAPLVSTILWSCSSNSGTPSPWTTAGAVPANHAIDGAA